MRRRNDSVKSTWSHAAGKEESPQWKRFVKKNVLSGSDMGREIMGREW